MFTLAWTFSLQKVNLAYSLLIQYLLQTINKQVLFQSSFRAVRGAKKK